MDIPDPATLRRPYADVGLYEDTLATDPVSQFGIWFGEAVEAGLAEPNAMILATVSSDGTPSARTVLLKGYGHDGFHFFTNHLSRKGHELAENPRACLVFPWHPLHRQVIIEGPVSRMSRAESAEYFQSRPRGSQLGAWASERQSSVITRAELERRYAELEERWPEPDPVPSPEFWGGYRVAPTAVEFWQGRPNRLHDRLRYLRVEERAGYAVPEVGEQGKWTIERLSP